MRDWYTWQINYVLTYLQAPAKQEHIYMKLPCGFTVRNGQSQDYLLHIKKNIYGSKAAGRVWYLHLHKKLQEVGFVVIKIDNCVFYYEKCIYILYMDNSIICRPTKDDIRRALHVLQKT